MDILIGGLLGIIYVVSASAAIDPELRTTTFCNETVVPVIVNDSINGAEISLHIKVSRYQLHLVLNEFLILPNFTSTYYDKEGRMITEQGFRNCYYQGWVDPFQYQNASFQGWNAILSTCRGLEGQFGNFRDGYIHIIPLQNLSSLKQEHTLFHVLENSSADYYGQDFFHMIKNTSGYARAKQFNTPGDAISGFFILEAVLVNDHVKYTSMGSDVEALVSNNIQLMNIVDMLYFPLDVNVVLTGVITWNNGDQITYPADNDGEVIQNNFGNYVSTLDGTYVYDLAVLISGRYFARNVLGIAFIDSICTRDVTFRSIVISAVSTIQRLAVTLAHEMGHTLGMQHDDEITQETCRCTDLTGFCIMESRLRGNVAPYSTWSSCSRNTLLRTVLYASCLYNNPTTIFTNPVCGNGVIEAGEECDCNSPTNCATFSPCCNTTSCTFHPSSTLCRPKGINGCDVADFCTGNTTICQNELIHNGTACTATNGQRSYCFQGECRTRDAQCKRHYGPNSRSAIDECYAMNTVGIFYGYCTISQFIFIPRYTYNRCTPTTQHCGLLHCEGGIFNSSSTTTNGLQFSNISVNDSNGTTHQCLSFSTFSTFRPLNPDALVSNGNPCPSSPNLVCTTDVQTDSSFCQQGQFGFPPRRECITAFDFPNVEQCSGHGRCTNLGRCICDAGFYLSLCNSSDECSVGVHNCQHICIDTTEGYNCSCNPGYMLDADGISCIDMDECVIENVVRCDQNCINTVGSFICNCNFGFILINDIQCVPDTDECLVNNGGCTHICTNILNSFTCSCTPGYRLANDRLACEDINECNEGTDNCQHNCTNTIGSFNCRCNYGYRLVSNRLACQDINECNEGTDNCQHNCINTIGSFNCNCNLGYRLANDRLACEDINECNEGTDNCPQIYCTNTIGSFNCSCNLGFQLGNNGLSCEDINECNEGTDNCQHNCINTIGNFNCSCRSGYKLANDRISCTGVSECCQNNGSHAILYSRHMVDLHIIFSYIIACILLH